MPSCLCGCCETDLRRSTSPFSTATSHGHVGTQVREVVAERAVAAVVAVEVVPEQ